MIYLVLAGFVFKSNDQIHFNGISDFRNLIAAVLLIIPAVFFAYLIGIYHTFKFFGHEVSLSFRSVFKWIRRIGKGYEINKAVVFDNKYVEIGRNNHFIYLITGLTSGVMLNEAFCYAWSFNKNETDIDIYLVTYKKKKADFRKIYTASQGVEYGFSLSHKKRRRVKCKLYLNNNDEWDLLYKKDTSATSSSSGIELELFENTPLRSNDVFIIPHYLDVPDKSKSRYKKRSRWFGR
ncbi:MAG: hypothetical protein WCH34_05320 [Bacteroidota bacterium]